MTDFTPISMIATVPSLLVGKLKPAIPRGSARKAIRVIKVPLVRAAQPVRPRVLASPFVRYTTNVNDTQLFTERPPGEDQYRSCRVEMAGVRL